MRKAIISVFLLALLGAIGFLGVRESRTSPDGAAAGDCVKKAAGQEVDLVDCADPAAEHRVLGRVENKTRIQAQVASGTICAAFPETRLSFWRGEEGKPGYVLCLGAARQ